MYLKRNFEHNKVNSNSLNVSNSFLLLFLNMWVVCFQVRVCVGTYEGADGHACVSVFVCWGSQLILRIFWIVLLPYSLRQGFSIKSRSPDTDFTLRTPVSAFQGWHYVWTALPFSLCLVSRDLSPSPFTSRALTTAIFLCFSSDVLIIKYTTIYKEFYLTNIWSCLWLESLLWVLHEQCSYHY